MTAIPSSKYPNMDLLHPDDTMDLASSPHIGADDLDFEVDEMRDASEEPNEEGMLQEPQLDGGEYLHIDDEELFRDDDMLDDDTAVENLDSAPNELPMEPPTQGPVISEDVDDEILYDEEEDIHNGHFAAHDLQDIHVENEEPSFHEEQVQEQTTEATNIQQIPLTSPKDVDEGSVQPETGTNLTNEDTEEPTMTKRHDPPGLTNLTEDNDTNRQAASTGDATRDFHPERDVHQTPEHDVPSFQHPEETNETTSIDNLSSNLDQNAAEHTVGSPESQAAADDAKSSPIEPPESEKAPGQDDKGSHEVHSTRLHTVKINYQDTEICLFPPNEDDDTETFFLSDTNLAYQSIDKLLAACREILAGTIDDDDELVLDVASLGLHISEGSSYAANITLSSILDVYLALSHNNQSENIQPLYCSLTSRISLASQYAYLLTAARQGKTFAEIAAEHLGSSEESADDLVESLRERKGNAEPFAENSNESKAEDITSEYQPADTERDVHATIRSGETDNPSELDQGLAAHPENQVHDEGHEYENALSENEFENSEDEDGEAEGNDKSATSTVRGDDIGTQGEYDPIFEICLAPEVCLCLSCDANEHIDFGDTSKAEHVFLNPEVPDIDHDGTLTKNAISSGLSADQTEVHVEISGAQVDTESSRTVEAESESYEPQYHDQNEYEYGFSEYPEDENDEEKDHYDSFPHEDDGAASEAEYDNEQFEEHFQEVSDAEDQTNASVDGDEHEQVKVQGVEEAEFVQNPEEDDLLDLEADDQVPTTSDKGLVESSNESAENEHVENHEDMFAEAKKSATSEITPPMTPSNNKSAKRKAREDDDDEFGLVDFSTPELKRRRPS